MALSLPRQHFPCGAALEDHTDMEFLEKPLISLNKESRLFFLCDNRIWSFRSFLPLAIAAFEGPEGNL